MYVIKVRKYMRYSMELYMINLRTKFKSTAIMIRLLGQQPFDYFYIKCG